MAYLLFCSVLYRRYDAAIFDYFIFKFFLSHELTAIILIIVAYSKVNIIYIILLFFIN